MGASTPNTSNRVTSQSEIVLTARSETSCGYFILLGLDDDDDPRKVLSEEDLTPQSSSNGLPANYLWSPPRASLHSWLNAAQSEWPNGLLDHCRLHFRIICWFWFCSSELKQFDVEPMWWYTSAGALLLFIINLIIIRLPRAESNKDILYLNSIQRFIQTRECNIPSGY